MHLHHLHMRRATRILTDYETIIQLFAHPLIMPSCVILWLGAQGPEPNHISSPLPLPHELASVFRQVPGNGIHHQIAHAVAEIRHGALVQIQALWLFLGAFVRLS